MPRPQVGSGPLHCASSKGSLEIVQYILEKWEQALQIKTINGMLPLHFAAGGRSLAVAQYIVETGGEECLQETTNDGMLPLHFAARAGKLEIAQFISGKWEQALRETTNDGRLPLHYAAGAWNPAVVQYFVEQWEDALQVQDSEGRLPLHYAAAIWNPKAAEYLVEKWEQGIHVRDYDGWIPLHVAASEGRLGQVKHFVQCCPSTLQAKSIDGSLPIDLARPLDGKLEVTEWLESRSKSAEPQSTSGKAMVGTPSITAIANSTEGPSTEYGRTHFENRADPVPGTSDTEILSASTDAVQHISESLTARPEESEHAIGQRQSPEQAKKKPRRVVVYVKTEQHCESKAEAEAVAAAAAAVVGPTDDTVEPNEERQPASRILRHESTASKPMCPKARPSASRQNPGKKKSKGRNTSEVSSKTAPHAELLAQLSNLNRRVSQIQEQQRASHSDLLAHFANLVQHVNQGREQDTPRSSIQHEGLGAATASTANVASPWSWLWRRMTNPTITSGDGPFVRASLLHTSVGDGLAEIHEPAASASHGLVARDGRAAADETKTPPPGSQARGEGVDCPLDSAAAASPTRKT